MFHVEQNGEEKRKFSNPHDAEKYARRLGPGAAIYEGLEHVASIVRGSFPRLKIVTEVTMYGGKYL